MYGQMDFGELFGDDFDLINAQKSKTSDKVAPEKAKKSKATPKKKGKVVDVPLPVTVYATSFEAVVSPKDNDCENPVVSSEELMKRLYDMGYTEVANLHKELFIPDDGSTVYIVTGVNEVTAVSQDTLIDLSDEKTVVFAYGMLKAEYSVEDFEGKDPEEIDVDFVKNKILESMPQFKGAKFCYDVESNTIVPMWEKKDKIPDSKKITLPIEVSILGKNMTIDEADVPEGTTAKDIIQYIKERYGHKDLEISLYSGENDLFFLEFSSIKKLSGSAANLKINKGANASKKQEKFDLPCMVYLSMNGHREELTPEKFDGKKKITSADITAYFSSKFSVFKSAEKVKGLNYTMDTIANILTVDSTPGRRGTGYRFYNAAYDFEEEEHYAGGCETEIITSIDELKDILKNTGRTILKGIICKKDCSWHNYSIFSNQIASYLYKECLTDVPYGVNMVLKIPRAPANIYDSIIAYFRSELPNEAICRLLYDHRAHCYFMDKPIQNIATNIDVKPKFAVTPYHCDVVATIHSHNSMPAFFSGVDDEAEKEEIGLFGVIGRLNTDEPEMKLRIAVEGGFTEVDPLFLFDSFSIVQEV